MVLVPLALGIGLPVGAAWVMGGLPKKGESKEVVEQKLKNLAKTAGVCVLATVLTYATYAKISASATAIKTTATTTKAPCPYSEGLVRVD